MRFVLVDDEQVPVSPQDVIGKVMDGSWQAAAEHFGLSESTLRKFVTRNGYSTRQRVWFEKAGEELPNHKHGGYPPMPQVPVPAGPEDEVF